jgi:hypothetical protein
MLAEPAGHVNYIKIFSLKGSDILIWNRRQRQALRDVFVLYAALKSAVKLSTCTLLSASQNEYKCSASKHC